MEHAATEAVPELLKYGAGGVIALLAICALAFVWNYAKDTAKQLAESNKSRAEDAERRFQEAKAVAEKATEGLVNASRSMAVLSVGFENTNRLNEDRLASLQTMAAQMGPLIKEVERVRDMLETAMEELRDLRRGGRS